MSFDIFPTLPKVPALKDLSCVSLIQEAVDVWSQGITAG